VGAAPVSMCGIFTQAILAKLHPAITAQLLARNFAFPPTHPEEGAGPQQDRHADILQCCLSSLTGQPSVTVAGGLVGCIRRCCSLGSIG
jgi:hypothetical protein